MDTSSSNSTECETQYAAEPVGEPVGELAGEPTSSPDADKASETPKFGPDGDGGYITPYTVTLVYRDKYAISEAISGVFTIAGTTVQRAVLSPIAPVCEFWSLCDHPSVTILFLDIPADDSVVEFSRRCGFQQIYFVAGEHHQVTEHTHSFPLEFIHTVIPRKAMFLGTRQYIELIARARVPDISVTFLPPMPTIGSPVAASHAKNMARGIGVLGMTPRDAGARIVSSVLHAEEYLRDWIAAGIASTTVFGILSKHKMESAVSVIWEHSGDTAEYSNTVEVTSVVSDELQEHILEEAVNALKDTPNPVALLICFPANNTEWRVRGYTLKLGAKGESCGGIFEELRANGRVSDSDKNLYFVPTSALVKYLPVLGN
jgi:hypothetical protein